MRTARRAWMLAVAILPCGVLAQSWQFVPSISLAETWSDNLQLQPDPFARTGWVTQLTPSLALDHVGPRLRLSLDYRHQRSYYAGESELDNAQNFLRLASTYEVIEKLAFIEARANITQENRSAFGAAVVPGSAAANDNRVETRMFGISPVVRGQLGDLAVYQARLNQTEVRTVGGVSVQGSTRQDTTELIASMRSASPSARIGWAVDARGLRSRTDAFETLEDRRIRADLIVGIAPQLHVSLVDGYERTDFTREGTRSDSTPGAGFEWSPSARTQLAAVAQRRFFGTGHLATFTHRTPRTAWRVSSSREASVLSTVLGASAGTLESLMTDLLTASIPDPVERTAAARRRLAGLGAAATTINTGFLTERPFLDRRIDASVAFIGARNTMTLGYRHSLQTALGAAPLSTADSFALSDEIRQRAYSAAWSYRLTPLTSLTLAINGLRTNGMDSAAPSSKEDLGTLFLTTRFGPRTSGSFGVRRVEFESNRASSYQETAVFGSLSFRL